LTIVPATKAIWIRLSPKAGDLLDNGFRVKQIARG
jgi:hypothetical protein